MKFIRGYRWLGSFFYMTYFVEGRPSNDKGGSRGTILACPHSSLAIGFCTPSNEDVNARYWEISNCPPLAECLDPPHNVPPSRIAGSASAVGFYLAPVRAFIGLANGTSMHETD